MDGTGGSSLRYISNRRWLEYKYCILKPWPWTAGGCLHLLREVNFSTLLTSPTAFFFFFVKGIFREIKFHSQFIFCKSARKLYYTMSRSFKNCREKVSGKLLIYWYYYVITSKSQWISIMLLCLMLPTKFILVTYAGEIWNAVDKLSYWKNVRHGQWNVD